MASNSISSFEYVSILISIILGLGITQILSSFSDLLYNYRKVTFYWPHTIWIMFLLFLFIQDWFVTYQLKDKEVWHLPELIFVLLYPIALFTTAKMLLPTNEKEEQRQMKVFYLSQYPVIFMLTAGSGILSFLFNVFLLHKTWPEQIHLFLFVAVMLWLSLCKSVHEKIHQLIAALLFIATVLSVILEKDVWVIK